MCVFVHVHVWVFTWCLMCLSLYSITFHHCVFAEEPAVVVLPVWRIVKLMCRVLCGSFAGDAGLYHRHLSVVNILHCIERLLLYSNSQPVIGTISRMNDCSS